MSVDTFTDPFIILLITTSLFIVSFTMFVNFIRGFALVLLVLGLFYYIFSDKETKNTLNIYSNNVYKSITKNEDFLKYKN